MFPVAAVVYPNNEAIFAILLATGCLVTALTMAPVVPTPVPITAALSHPEILLELGF